jgi:hypothetical protein
MICDELLVITRLSYFSGDRFCPTSNDLINTNNDKPLNNSPAIELSLCGYELWTRQSMFGHSRTTQQLASHTHTKQLMPRINDPVYNPIKYPSKYWLQSIKRTGILFLNSMAASILHYPSSPCYASIPAGKSLMRHNSVVAVIPKNRSAEAGFVAAPRSAKGFVDSPMTGRVALWTLFASVMSVRFWFFPYLCNAPALGTNEPFRRSTDGLICYKTQAKATQLRKRLKRYIMYPGKHDVRMKSPKVTLHRGDVLSLNFPSVWTFDVEFSEIVSQISAFHNAETSEVVGSIPSQTHSSW